MATVKPPAGFQDLPDEILLKIAENLVPFNALWAFSTGLNKQCARIGQELLYKECDLSIQPRVQPHLFMRTMLETPALRPGVQKVAYV